jgi:CRP-like cAMP-binding protein
MAAAEVSALKLSALHADLNDAERAALAGQMVFRDYPDGTAIFAQNDPGDGAYVVLEGRVKIAKRLPGGKTIAVAAHASGALFGELVLAGRGGLRTAGAEAVGQTRLLFLPLDSFQASLRQPGSVAAKLLSRLATLIAARLVATLDDIPASPVRRGESPNPQAGADFSVRAFLHKLPLCAELGEEGQDWMFTESQVVTAVQGTALTDAVWLVVRGAVRALHGTHQLEVRGPGRFCGAADRLGGHPPLNLTFTTSEDSVLLRFPLDRFDAMVSGEDALSLALTQAVIADTVMALLAANAWRARETALAGL